MSTPEFDLLWGLDRDETVRLRELASRVHFASGDVLFDLGAEADTAYVIDAGRIALTLPVQIGGKREDVLVEERQAGQTVGWSALIPPHRFTLKARALVDTDVLAFARGAVLDHFAAHPAVGYVVAGNLAAVIGQRLQVFQAMWLREMQRVIDLRSA